MLKKGSIIFAFLFMSFSGSLCADVTVEQFIKLLPNLIRSAPPEKQRFVAGEVSQSSMNLWPSTEIDDLDYGLQTEALITNIVQKLQGFYTSGSQKDIFLIGAEVNRDRLVLNPGYRLVGDQTIMDSSPNCEEEDCVSFDSEKPLDRVLTTLLRPDIGVFLPGLISVR